MPQGRATTIAGSPQRERRRRSASATTVLALAGALLSAACTSSRPTLKGPFLDVASAASTPCVIDQQARPLCWRKGWTAVGSTPAKRLIGGSQGVCVAGENGNWTCLQTLAEWKQRPVDLPSGCEVAVGLDSSCAARPDGRVACWSDRARDPRIVEGVVGATEVAVGGASACAVLSDHTVTCWPTDPSDPANDLDQPLSPVAGLTDVRSLALGEQFACALHGDGGVSCWGAGNVGQLGRRQTSRLDAYPPGRVEGLAGAVQIVASHQTACALQRDGKVKCWGRNAACQLGIAKRKVGDLSELPLEVPKLPPSRKIALSGSVGCSLSTRGELTCWGNCYHANDPDVRLSE